MAAGALAAMSLFCIGSAQAMPLSYSTTYNGAINVTTGGGANTVLPVPGSDFYGNTFSLPTNPNFPTASSYGFYDDFIFTIPVGAGSNSVTSSISIPGALEITDLQARLFALPGAYNPNSMPGAPCPGGCLAIWGTTVVAANVTYTVLNPIVLGPGSYVLQIRRCHRRLRWKLLRCAQPDSDSCAGCRLVVCQRLGWSRSSETPESCRLKPVPASLIDKKPPLAGGFFFAARSRYSSSLGDTKKVLDKVR